jgi:hypothetical protein
LARSLLSFNLGVEAGQIVIGKAALAGVVLDRPAAMVLPFRIGASVLILLFGLAWFLDRACGAKLVPF